MAESGIELKFACLWVWTLHYTRYCSKGLLYLRGLMGFQCSHLLPWLPNHKGQSFRFLHPICSEATKLEEHTSAMTHTSPFISMPLMDVVDLREPHLFQHAPKRATHLANTSVLSPAPLVSLWFFNIRSHTPNQQSVEELSLTCSCMLIHIHPHTHPTHF